MTYPDGIELKELSLEVTAAIKPGAMMTSSHDTTRSEQQRLDAEYASRRAAEMALIEYAERRGTEIEWRDERHVPKFYP